MKKISIASVVIFLVSIFVWGDEQKNDPEKQKAMENWLKSLGGGQQQGGGGGDFMKILQQMKQKAGGERAIKNKSGKHGKKKVKKAKKAGRKEKQPATGTGEQQIENLGGDTSTSIEGAGAVAGGEMQNKGNEMKLHGNKKKKNKPYVGQTLQNMGSISPKKKQRTKKGY